MIIMKGASRVGASQAVKFEDLTKTGQDRANYLTPKFKSDSVALVYLLDSRGKNSWITVDEKITFLDQAPFDLKRYHDVILEHFVLGDIYTMADISGSMAELRRDCRLPAFVSRLEANCLNDFCAVFLVDDVYEPVLDENGNPIELDGKPLRKFVGYMPTFKLKSDN